MTGCVFIQVRCVQADLLSNVAAAVKTEAVRGTVDHRETAPDRRSPVRLGPPRSMSRLTNWQGGGGGSGGGNGMGTERGIGGNILL